VFFMGATLVLTSFTCTAPIVGTLLANAAHQGPLRVGLGMGVFGLTMALPFVVLALVPTRVKQMPRSGEWMETLKVSLGFVEFAASFKFLSQVDIALGWQILPRELFLMLWAAIFGLWAMYLFGILRKAGSANDGVGAGRMASGMLVSLLATYFLFGALGNRLDFLMTNFVPSYSAGVVVARADGHAREAPYDLVKDDAPAAVALASREGKLLLYNFTGFN
jgi:thiol:disulfide interchange protein DsbD